MVLGGKKAERHERAAATAARLSQEWPRARWDDPARMTVDETGQALVRAFTLPTGSARHAARRRKT